LGVAVVTQSTTDSRKNGSDMKRMTEQPNVVVIMSDEQRWDSLGSNGSRVSRTPAVDDLAKRGTSFEHCFATYPLCCPSRMSIWTGLMPHDHQGFGNWRLLREDLRDQGLIAPFVRDGYHTIYNGKWHVPGTTPARFGFADAAAVPAVLKGFDRGRYIEEYREYVTSQGYDLVPELIENLTAGDVDQLNRPGSAPYGTAEIPIEHYLEPWQTDRLLEQLDRRADDHPFFAVCSYNAPHFPMIVPEPYDRMIDPDSIELPPNFCAGQSDKPREVTESHFHESEWSEREWRNLIAHYLGFCALIDDQVDRILNYLDASGLRDNTIVVFTSDHGDMIGSHCLNQKGYPLHYDEALRVPLVMSGPGIDANQRIDQLVSLMDLVPTLADLCNVSIDVTHDGQSFAPALRGDDSWTGREAIIAESFLIGGKEGGHGDAVDAASFDLERDGINMSVRTSTHRYIFRLHDRDELYDVVADPYELRNIRDSPGSDSIVRQFQLSLAESLTPSLPNVAAQLREVAGDPIDALRL